jgi:hypothetical protein
LYQIEYPTIIAENCPTMLFGDLGVNAGRLVG